MADFEKINPLPYTSPIVDKNGILTVQAQSFFETITNRALIFGTGSPEGLVSAQKGAEYMDEAGSTGTIKWIKRNSDIGGDDRFGWILQ